MNHESKTAKVFDRVIAGSKALLWIGGVIYLGGYFKADYEQTKSMVRQDHDAIARVVEAQEIISRNLAVISARFEDHTRKPPTP